MSTARCLILILVLHYSLPLQAAIKQPDCASLERWTAGLDTKDLVQIAAKIQLPSRLLDASLVPVYGKPILSWTKAEFREAGQQLNLCRKEAGKRRDKAAAASLADARSLIQRAAGSARYYQQYLPKTEAAVAQLEAQAPSESLAQAMDLAMDALQQQDVRKATRGLSYDQQRPLQTIMQGAPYLPEADASRLVERLQRQQAALTQRMEAQAAEAAAAAEAARVKAQADARAAEEARQAEQARAREALQAAREKMNNAAVNPYGLMLLEGMADLPELEKVPPEEKQAFLDALYSKHNELSLAVRQAQAEAAQQKAQGMLDQLKAMDADELQDLGRLYAYRDARHEALRQASERPVAQAFEDGFNAYFAQVLDKLSPDFETALNGIPADAAGLKRLDSAVTDLTGIPRQTPKLNRYYALVEARRQAMASELERLACREVWQRVDLSAGEAQTPLWGAGRPTTLGDFVCAVVKQGNQVHAYEDSGLLSDVHTLKLTDKSEGLVTLKLHPGEVQPGRQMLLGFEISDANQTRPLSVKEWEAYASTVLEGGSLACERLANKPRSELSVNESMKLMECIMGQLSPPR